MLSPFLEILFGHNLWATRLLIERSAALSPEQFHQRFEIGPGSVHDTLRHIVGAMLRWADRIGGREVRESIERNGRHYAAAEFTPLLEQAHHELYEVALGVQAADGWSAQMEARFGDAPWVFTRAAAITHVLTHGIHHRAQVLNMHRRLGLPPLDLALDPVEWEMAQARSAR